MNGKFILYALIVSFVCTMFSWGALLDGPGGSSSSSHAGSGSTWSSNTGSGGGSWGSGGHK